MSNVFNEYLDLVRTKVDSEDHKKYANLLEINSEESKEPISNESSLNYFTSNALIKRASDTKLFTMKENVLTDFINKVSLNSLQMRNNHEKEALEKNLLLIGKLVYKLSKQLNDKHLV